MTEEQLIVFKIFLEFKRICDKSKLRYFAIGGTCIGAVRHNGFIPWDDDLDVAMPYDDYTKFINIAKTELNPDFSLYLPEDHKCFFNNFFKIIDNNTTIIEKGFLNYPDRYTGVFIDVMPIYGMPSSKKKQIIYSEKCNLYLTINIKIREPYRTDNSLLNKTAWILLYPLRFFKNYNRYIEKINNMFREIPFNNSDVVLFGWRRYKKKPVLGTYQCILPYYDFRDSIDMPFEKTTIKVPIEYDDYLSREFGNYMELPPVEKQKNCHEVDVIDLKKSYLEYKKDSKR